MRQRKDGVYKIFHGISTDLSLGTDLNITVADSELAPIDSSMVRGGKATGADNAGADLTISGGLSTGSANGGSIVFKTSSAGGAGSSSNTASTAMTINSSQQVITASDLSVAGAMTANAELIIDEIVIDLSASSATATFVATGSYHEVTPHASGNTLTSITGGTLGQILILRSKGTGGTLTLDADVLNGTADRFAMSNDIVLSNPYSTATFLYNGTNWSLISSNIVSV